MSNQKVKGATVKKTELPPIPDKIYFSIGEVGRLCLLKPHVLRYWEQEFSQLAPSKRRGNRRYYQRKDVMLVRRIRALLYDQGYTIEGARGRLLDSPELEDTPDPMKLLLTQTMFELEELVGYLEA